MSASLLVSIYMGVASSTILALQQYRYGLKICLWSWIKNTFFFSKKQGQGDKKVNRMMIIT